MVQLSGWSGLSPLKISHLTTVSPQRFMLLTTKENLNFFFLSPIYTRIKYKLSELSKQLYNSVHSENPE